MRFTAMIRTILTLLALALSADSLQAKQVALVVANAEYENTSKLANPHRDATLISAALQKAGFDTVELGTDLDRNEFMERLRAFRAAADGAEAALVYFAGHGIESDGRNWLLPTDTRLDAEKDLPFEAIELQLLLDTLDGAKLRIAVLDACRNNPYANRWASQSRSAARGLAPFEVDNMLVIYAAAPGAVAYDGEDGNSPFALALARRIVQPGLPVQMLGGMVRDDVLASTQGEQRPFISASMTGRPLFLVDGPETQMAWLNRLYSGETDAGRATDTIDDEAGPATAAAAARKAPTAKMPVKAKGTRLDTTDTRFALGPKAEVKTGGKGVANTAGSTTLSTGPGATVHSTVTIGTGSPPGTINFANAVDQLATTRPVAEGNRDWLDEQTWLETLKADTIPAYRAYLADFPEGLYAPYAEANIAQLLDPTATGGELDSAKPWIISLGAALPNRYAVDLAEPLAIDGVWRISTNNKRLRIERGRAFAVDGWNHVLLFKVKPDQVTTINLRQAEPGRWLGRDILLNGDTELTLREDGDLDVTVKTFPFPAKFKLLREGLDNPDALRAVLRKE